MPELIPRPDYADHPNGRSASEESLRGNTTIKVLNDEEIEAMHVSCRLGREGNIFIISHDEPVI